MSGADEEWVKAAMSDDGMVVELLVRLHNARHSPPPPPLLKRATLPLEWSVRQRRSKPVPANKNPKKLAHRDSPTTPLSWSGVTSFSAGSEESSRPIPLKHPSSTRSKVNIDSEKTNSKRSRKKKTLAELKDEENSLLKERRDLKKEMAALHIYLERQKTTNGNLKRMKIELQLDRELKTAAIAEESISSQLQPEVDVTTSHPTPAIMPPSVPANDATLQSLSSYACPEEKTDAKFILPDLNMPFDEPNSDVIN